MGMSREMLKQYLQNRLLVDAIGQKRDIDEMRCRLRTSIHFLNDVGISEADAAVRVKLDEYVKASRAYDALIWDVWGLNRKQVNLVSEYLDYDIDDLPEHVDD